MGRAMYYKQSFVVFRATDGIIVYNKNKPFSTGHTHLKSTKAGLDAINFVIKRKIPKRCSNHYLISLIRLSNDDKYIAEINSLMEVRHSKGVKPTCRKHCNFSK